MAMYHSYTDIRRNIRENVSVNREDRITNQKVKLLNDENVYYGSFSGQVQTNDAYVTGGVIDGAKLSNCVIYEKDGSEVNVSEVGEDIVRLRERTEDLEEEQLVLRGDVGKCLSYVGKFKVSSDIALFNELFSIADNQLDFGKAVKRGQLFQLTPDSRALSVEGMELCHRDMLMVTNDVPILHATSADVQVLRLHGAEAELSAASLAGKLGDLEDRVQALESRLAELDGQ